MTAALRSPRPPVRRLAVVDPVLARRRVPGLVGVSALVVLVVMLATAAVHIGLISGQRRLDGINAEINAARRTQESLRRRETMLRSPAEVQRLATETLGMVPAEQPALLTPRRPLIGVIPPGLFASAEQTAATGSPTPTDGSGGR